MHEGHHGLLYTHHHGDADERTSRFGPSLVPKLVAGFIVAVMMAAFLWWKVLS